jgi:two-component system chemotaxis sensor kinase CheA
MKILKGVLHRAKQFYGDLSIARKTVIIMVFLVVSALMVSGAYNYRIISKKIELLLGQKLEHIARTGALQISPAIHQKIVEAYINQENNIDQKSEFKEVQQQLRRIQRANDLTSDVYTLFHPDWAKDNMIFIAMSNPKTYVGNGMPMNATAQRVFDTAKPAHTALYEDSEGIWVSAFSPILDAAGKVTALLEVDYNAKAEVAAAKNELFRTLGIATAFGILLSVVLGTYLGKVFSSPIVSLAGVARKVSGGDLSIRLNPEETAYKDEIGTLAFTFDNMIVELKSSREALEDYAKNLEKKVAERTAELKASNDMISAMVNSLGQGFLIFDERGSCHKIHSLACHDLLEIDPADRPVADVLKVPEGQRARFSDWASTLFIEPIPFDDLVGLGQKLYTHSHGKHIVLEYKPIRSEEGTISNVVMIATDRTAERDAQLRAQEERAFSEMVVKITRDKAGLTTAVADTRSMLQSLREDGQRQDPSQINHDQVLRYLHTIKGAAATYSVSSLKDATHRWEGLLIPLHNEGNQQLFQQQLKACEEELSTLLKKFVQETREILGVDMEAYVPALEVPLEVSKGFLGELLSGLDLGDLAKKFIFHFIAEPISKFFKSYDSAVQSLAERQGKRVNPLQFNGGDLRVIADHYREIFASLVHAFRNAVDHGLETPEEREAANKNPLGTIRVEFKRVSEAGQPWIMIEIADDGRGIDPQAIRKKLVKIGKSELAENPDDLEVIQHVFDRGFSTRDSATDVSGRGIGMDAIRDAVVSLGGDVHISSVMGQGTVLSLKMPDISTPSGADTLMTSQTGLV